MDRVNHRSEVLPWNLPFATRNTERHRIDREIESTLEKLRELRGRRNELAPIFRLSSDVLSIIFRYSVSRLKSPFSFPSSHAFSHVCQHWRSVALDTAALWTLLPRATQPLTELFLSRSGGHSLYFSDAGRLKYPTHGSTKTTLSHMDRIRSIKLLPISEGRKRTRLRLSSAAPQLTTCLIIASWDQHIRLPDNFLGLYAPRLRHLTLRLVTFKWDMLCCPALVQNLTVLELGALAAACFPSGPQLVAALRSMPALRTLQLQHTYDHHVWLSNSEENDPPSDIAVVDQLRTLSVDGPRARTSELFRYIRCPSLFSLSVDFLSSSDEEASMMSSLATFMQDQQTCQVGSTPVYMLVVEWQQPLLHNYQLTAYSNRWRARRSKALPRRQEQLFKFDGSHVPILPVVRLMCLDRVVTVEITLPDDGDTMKSPSSMQRVMDFLTEMSQLSSIRNLNLHLKKHGRKILHSLLEHCAILLIQRYRESEKMLRVKLDTALQTEDWRTWMVDNDAVVAWDGELLYVSRSKDSKPFA